MIVVTGAEWAHRGFRTADAVVDEILRGARRDVVMTVYLATATTEFLTQISQLLSRGVEVRLIFNDWSGLSQRLRTELIGLQQRYSGLHLYGFRDVQGRGVLHAKAVVVDGIKAVVGSANISRAGMLWNYELGILLTGAEAESVSRLLYGLIESGKVENLS